MNLTSSFQSLKPSPVKPFMLSLFVRSKWSSNSTSVCTCFIRFASKSVALPNYNKSSRFTVLLATRALNLVTNLVKVSCWLFICIYFSTIHNANVSCFLNYVVLVYTRWTVDWKKLKLHYQKSRKSNGLLPQYLILLNCYASRYFHILVNIETYRPNDLFSAPFYDKHSSYIFL